DGNIQLRIELANPAEFSVRLRIPDWCHTYTLHANGEPYNTVSSQGYVSIQREWQNGDTIALSLDMPVERVYAHPLVSANRGRVALQRDRKSTRLNSSHVKISYAVFCLT